MNSHNLTLVNAKAVTVTLGSSWSMIKTAMEVTRILDILV